MKDFEKTMFVVCLQLFAEPNTNVTTDTGLSVENKTYYDKNLIEEAKANLVHDQFGQKRNIPKNGGKKIEFRKFASLPKATTPLTEGVTPNGKKLAATSIEAEVKWYGDYVVQSDVLELTAIDNTIVEATKVLGRQAGMTLDTVVRNVLQGGTNVFYAPKSDGTPVTSRDDLDNTCKMTVDLVNRVVAFLKKNNAPKINGFYVAIIHPLVAYDLLSDPLWIDAHKYATPDNIYEGELGKVGGVRFVESTEAKIYSDGVFGCLFMGDGAYGTTEVEGGGLQTIIKQKGSAGTADPLDQRSSIGWKGGKTAEILVEPYLIRVECKSALSDQAEEN
ncbi:MAG: N4-gp56 family major capsid protein [Clostridia bacterium]|nr:N4-gp56 family major capsid protein [Clostridia bacterium]